MKSNNLMIPKLYTLLADELKNRKPYLTPQSLIVGDRQRLGIAILNVRYFIAVLENHIMEHTASVVFIIEVAEDSYTLRFYIPLQAKEYDKLATLHYTPVLRSKVYLTVGLGQGDGIGYAYSSVKLSMYSSVIDMFNALFVLQRELEMFLEK